MDISTIVDRLSQNTEAICRRYLSQGRRSGNYWIVGDIRNHPGRSTFVRLSTDGYGRQAGRWQDAATGEFGDLLDLIREARGFSTFADTLAEARHFLGVLPDRLKPSITSDIKAEAPSIEAARLFSRGRPIAGTIAEHYLQARGLSCLRALTALRFIPACPYYEEGTPPAPWPALLAAVTDDAGRLQAIQRTYLRSDGRFDVDFGKAPVEAPRKSLGTIESHAVRFGSADEIMGAGEGLETVLSLRAIFPALSVMAALSAKNLAHLSLPLRLRRLYVIRDNDADGARAFERLAERGACAGIEVICLQPRLRDLNDDLRSFGHLGVIDHIRSQLALADRRRF